MGDAHKKWDTKTFIDKMKEKYPDLDFSMSEYKSYGTKVKYICKEHGIKYSTPSALLRGTGKGCRSCGQSGAKISKDTWVERFKEFNNDNISYEKLPKSFKAKDKITFICAIHGEFKQMARNHANGASCIKCGYNITGKYTGENPNGWRYSLWKKSGENSKYFDGFKCYIIKCWNENEEFYKIGKTFNTLKKRFKAKGHMPYNYEIVKVFKGEAREVSEIEKKLHRDNKEHKYIPNIFFKGNNECYKNLK